MCRIKDPETDLKLVIRVSSQSFDLINRILIMLSIFPCIIVEDNILLLSCVRKWGVVSDCVMGCFFFNQCISVNFELTELRMEICS